MSTDGPIGAQLRYWIGLVLRDERERAKIDPERMARVIGVSKRTIKRVEDGDSWSDIDLYVAGYAYALGIDDGRLLWQQAIERWQGRWEGGEDEGGTAPTFDPPPGPDGAFADAIRQETLRKRRDADGRTGKRRANRKRATGGQ